MRVGNRIEIVTPVVRKGEDKVFQATGIVVAVFAPGVIIPDSDMLQYKLRPRAQEDTCGSFVLRREDGSYVRIPRKHYGNCRIIPEGDAHVARSLREICGLIAALRMDLVGKARYDCAGRVRSMEHQFESMLTSEDNEIVREMMQDVGKSILEGESASE